nr:MAG TPA: hypothetical protein [Caudoviricetes sp.]
MTYWNYRSEQCVKFTHCNCREPGGSLCPPVHNSLRISPTNAWKL